MTQAAEVFVAIPLREGMVINLPDNDRILGCKLGGEKERTYQNEAENELLPGINFCKNAR